MKITIVSDLHVIRYRTIISTSDILTSFEI